MLDQLLAQHKYYLFVKDLYGGYLNNCPHVFTGDFLQANLSNSMN
jgi:hypothetical protein